MAVDSLAPSAPAERPHPPPACSTPSRSSSLPSPPSSFERDRSALTERAAYREPALGREGIGPPSTSTARPASGLALLALPLLVIATIAVFARLGDRPPPRKPPRLHPAEVGGLTVFTAAYHHRNRPETTSPACPTLDDLIAAKRLSRAETLDPWGTPYQVRCEGDYIDVRSAGEDRVPGTPDDIITNPSML